MSTANPLTTAEVLQRLRTKFSDNGYALFTEVGDATGMKQKRWADALVMSLWPSRGLELMGFEIKVSRGDWKRELADPSKAEAICKYCDRWTIVAGGKGIVQLDELPKSWGLMEADGNGLKVRKQAPLLQPVPLDRAFVAAICRRASEQSLDDKTLAQAISAEREKWRQEQRETERRESLRQSQQPDPVAHLTSKIREFTEASGINPFDWRGPKRIGEAVRIVLENDGEPPGMHRINLIRRAAEEIIKEISKLDEVPA